MIHKLAYNPEDVSDPRLSAWLDGATVYRSQADMNRFTRETPKPGDTLRFLVIIGPKKKVAREKFSVFVPANVAVELAYFNAANEDVVMGEPHLRATSKTENGRQ